MNIRPLIPALGLSLALLASAQAGWTADRTETLRPEVGKPLQDAQKLIGARQFKEALAPIEAAEKVEGLTDYEAFVIAQMRGAASSGAGDTQGAAAAFEKVLAAKRLPPEEQLRILEAVAGSYLRVKNYPKAIEWIQAYQDAGGTRAETLGLLPQAHYLAGDFEKAAQTSAAQILATEKNGGRPSEEQLKLLASSQVKRKDMAGYAQVLEKLVRWYPNPQYWADLIQRTASRPGFSRTLDLDMYRLLRATQTLNTAQDYMEMAQLAVQAGLPGEARSIVEEGFGKKILGSGEAAEIERQNRLKALVERKSSEDQAAIGDTDAIAAKAESGDALVKTGLAYLTYGDAPKGLSLMQQGLEKGRLKSLDQSRLHLGYAFYLAGDKTKAVDTFKSVAGSDGAADLARLWILVAAH